MSKSNGLIHKINRAFLLQGLLITLAVILGVFFAKIVIEQILIKNAILEEENYFWQQYEKDPSFPLPDTKNLTGYFDSTLLPDLIQGDIPQEQGFYEYGKDEDGLVMHISQRRNQTLYLLYYRGQVDALVLYYGIFPLLTVLLILYLSLWLTYRDNRRTVSPIILLAKEINRLDLNQPEISIINDFSGGFDANNEIQTLSDAISRLGERLNDFISRERNFTRDASHELRSPLTVINIAADMLLSEQELSPPAYKSVIRIKRAVDDMRQLTEVFLLLARENEDALTTENFYLNDIIEEEIEQATLLNKNKNVIIKYQPRNRLNIDASAPVISVLLGNLIRNAILYTDQGEVTVCIDQKSVIISDSGHGIPTSQLDQLFKPFQRGENENASGYGIGLTIVKRLSERFNWPLSVHSQAEKGTQFEVQFPLATVSELELT